MKPKFDIYIWACEQGHYFAMDSNGWLMPGSLTPPKSAKSLKRHLEEGQMCPFCPKTGGNQNRKQARRVLYLVKEMERVTDISEEAQSAARKALKKMHPVSLASRGSFASHKRERQEILDEDPEAA